jgi:hypothetical protein
MGSLHQTYEAQNTVDLLPSSCITLEEHATFGDESPFYTEIWKTFPQQRLALLDHDVERLADMDAGHVSIQVLSQLPGIGMTKTLPAAAVPTTSSPLSSRLIQPVLLAGPSSPWWTPKRPHKSSSML